MSQSPAYPQPESDALILSAAEVAGLLQIEADKLETMSRTFAPSLGNGANVSNARYTYADLATLITVQKLAEMGLNDNEIASRLMEKSVPGPVNSGAASSPDLAYAVSTKAAPPAFVTASTSAASTSAVSESTTHDDEEPEAQGEIVVHGKDAPQNLDAKALGAMVHTVASSQQAMLNVQDSVKEMLGVIVQDNFNLKHENRKLRERMLELERALAEYQRREETRKERQEGRLRALEGTLGAMQQQLAQLLQIQRQRQQNQQNRPRGWFW